MIDMGKNKKENELVRMPQPYGKAAIFAPTAQNASRTVNIGAESVWEIGVPHPNPKYRHLSEKFMRAFDIRHAQVIFGLLNYYHSRGLAYNQRVDISYNHLLEICGFTIDGRARETIKDILTDLQSTYTAMRKGNTSIIFNVLGEVSIREDHEKGTTSLEYIVFSESFIDMLSNYNEYFNFYLTFWNKLPSRIAQSIYLYLPSRAVYKGKDDPFEITLTNLLNQLGIEVPKHKSSRKKIFEQNKNSIMDQLNGAPIAKNRILRVELRETVDQKDFKLCVWTDNANTSDIEYSIDDTSKLSMWWIEAGGTPKEFAKRMHKKEDLTYYETERLKEAGINVEKDMAYLKMAKALLDSAIFTEIAGTMAMLKKTSGLNAPYSYFTNAIKNEITRTHKQCELPL